MRRTVRTVLATCIGIVVLAEHAAAEWWEPQPFRRDVIEGRQFDYNAESFLHRFTFEPKPALGTASRPLHDGIFGTAGSTRSAELYTRQQVQLTADFDGPSYFRYRYRRLEDFDGRYDSNLVGFGTELANGWIASVHGDVEGAKENIDVHSEVAWSNDTGNRFRAAIVAPDMLFNDKQGQARYERQPYTYYLGGARRVGEAEVYGFANYNDYTRLNDTVRAFTYRYEQARAGVGLDVPIARDWEGSIEVEGVYTTRRLQDRGGEMPDQRLRRRHNQVTAEVRHAYGPATGLWGGVRYFRLMERDRGADGDPVDRHERRERMVYGGVTWRINERMRFAPGVFLNHADIREREDGEADDESGFYGKLTLPLQIIVDQARGGSVTLNPTARLHSAAFGGGNVQVHLPF